jgi:hypothetical protein
MKHLSKKQLISDLYHKEAEIEYILSLFGGALDDLKKLSKNKIRDEAKELYKGWISHLNEVLNRKYSDSDYQEIFSIKKNIIKEDIKDYKSEGDKESMRLLKSL